MRFVDSHLHLWDVSQVPLSWFRDGQGLPARAVVDDLLADLAATGAAPPEGAVVVQAADTLAELRWLLAAAERDPLVSAVVAQYEPRPGWWAGTAQAVLDHPALAGIRLAVPTRAADLSDVPGVDELAAGLAATGAVLELLIRPEQLPAAASVAAAHPDLTIVLCHLGLGGNEPDDRWRQGLQAVAEHARVMAKVSGLHTPGRDPASVPAIVADAVGILGIERLMFGSDWPISTRTFSYQETLRRTHAALPELEPRDADSFWRGLATRLYLG
ncbi:amidohydrolase family protein [Pseudactinotalea suaedae]|uniref:amidohydrolase family protein n=1 Tax=Pseudactinotalea suaedae TaxID=1524924 RepID=UPI001391B9D8|nr:amidohydrolase family protein [Pseudactinotalea suaedae]